MDQMHGVQANIVFQSKRELIDYVTRQAKTVVTVNGAHGPVFYGYRRGELIILKLWEPIQKIGEENVLGILQALVKRKRLEMAVLVSEWVVPYVATKKSGPALAKSATEVPQMRVLAVVYQDRLVQEIFGYEVKTAGSDQVEISTQDIYGGAQIEGTPFLDLYPRMETDTLH